MDESAEFSRLQEPLTAERVSDTPPKRPPGRPPGSRNRIGRDAAETIILRGRPIEFLCQVTRGEKVKAGDPNDAGKRIMAWPTMDQRMAAARILASKVIADLKAVEVSGAEGAALFPAEAPTVQENRQLARAILTALGSGVVPTAAEPAGTPQGSWSDSSSATAVPLEPADIEPSNVVPIDPRAAIRLQGKTAEIVVRFADQQPDGAERWLICRDLGGSRRDGVENMEVIERRFSRADAEARARKLIEEGKL